ncbi:MAG: proline--tRNA ligase [Elusimicrobiota bacterium]
MKSARYSQYFIPTLKEDPREAEIVSHSLMIRAGMIRKLASGIYEFLPLGWRVVKKIEQIIRQEMDSIQGQEMLMSALQPRQLWDKSGRWDLYGPELLRLKDRKERDFCLGPTHEEVITSIVASEVRSYKQLPLLLYQFQMKFRDEIRPRFGIMRAREFYMKDAYSFDTTEQKCRDSYRRNVEAYNRIFQKCGLDFVKVEAATGHIGGESSHEFMVLADTGEEEIAFCSCGYGANTELASYKSPPSPNSSNKNQKELSRVSTPGKKTVEEVSEFLGEEKEKFIKTLIFESDRGPLAVLIRGDHELNENSVLKFAPGASLASEKTIKDISGAPAGFAGPVGINRDKLYKMLADKSVTSIENALSGANEKDFHLKNINYGRDYEADAVGDFRRARKGDLCPRCSETLSFKRGIEVGHTFILGKKYSKAMGALFTDSDGQEKNMIMGCYGIGVTRIAAALIEQSHDKDGIIWPAPIAPFHINIIQIGKGAQEICNQLYEDLSDEYEVLLDDRDESPGVKFKDSLLIGCPLSIVAGRKYKNEGKLELQWRKSGEKELTEPGNIKKRIKETLKK